MNRTDYLSDSQGDFSLPNGFFQNPGGGNINSGLKPVNPGNVTSTRSVRPNSTSLPPQLPINQQTPTNSFENTTQTNQIENKKRGFNFGHINPFIKKKADENISGTSPRQNSPQLPLADGRYDGSPTQPINVYNPYLNRQNSQPPYPGYPYLQQNPQPLINRQVPTNFPPHPQNTLLNYQSPQYLPQHLQNSNNINIQAEQANLEHHRLMAESKAHIAKEKHYTNTLVIAIGALFLYFVGTFIIIFTSNVGGQTIVNLPTYTLSWELLFSNPAKLFTNLFLTVFGYFFQYARLFGFFPELGNLTVAPVPRYLMPVDILIKVGTILYFNYRWMPWDTKKAYEYGCFNSKYPHLTDEDKITAKPDDKPNFELQSINISSAELEKQTKVTAKPQVTAPLPPNSPVKPHANFEEDEEEDHGILPFSGVQKPIEEWYYENETKIYGFIRTQILPGSNMVLALYFSTLRVLDLRQPAFILFYILGIMSMFWCMQTFLLILDHNQYPPDED